MLTKDENADKFNVHFIHMLALLFFIKAIILAFAITPLWDIPDEIGHFAYARDIATGKGIPLLGEGKIDADIRSHVSGTTVDKPQDNWIAQHPPVYYLAAGLALKVGAMFTDDAETLFRIPRVVSALSGALTLVVLYHLFGLFRLSPVVSLGLTAFVSFIPMFSHLSSGTNHDMTVTLFATLGTFYWFRFLLYDNVRDTYFCALWLSLAAATKMTALVILAPMVSIMIFELSSPWIVRLKQSVSIVMLSLFLPGLWMLRHYLAFGNPFATAVDVFSGFRFKDNPLQVTFIEFINSQPVFEHFFLHFFGLFGWTGTGRGELYWDQITGGPLMFYSLLTLLLLLTSVILLARQSSNLITKFPSSNATTLSSVFQRALVKVGADRLLITVFIVAAIIVMGALYHLAVVPENFGGVARRVIFALIAGACMLSFIVFIKSMAREDKVIYYALVVLGFFGAVLLWKIYGFYLSDGRLRATHGRYFYPLIPLIMVGLFIPAIRYLKPPALVVIVSAVLIIFAEMVVYLQQVIPFYRSI